MSSVESYSAEAKAKYHCYRIDVLKYMKKISNKIKTWLCKFLVARFNFDHMEAFSFLTTVCC